MATISLTLTRIRALLSTLSPANPQDLVPTIHITGTNGKGSVSSYIDSILTSSGYTTGRFNSPFLVTPHDSIRINGEVVDQLVYEQERRVVERANDKLGQERASEFEVLTATAFRIFTSVTPKVDVGIVEVGMGGEGDATNVIKSPLVSVFTSVDLDHQSFLGSTVKDIASVKAGIVKKGSTVVIGKQKWEEISAVIEERARSLDCKVVHAGVANVVEGEELDNVCDIPTSSDSLSSIRSRVPLLGAHQLENVGTAVAVIDILRSHPSTPSLTRISHDSIAQGVSCTKWTGRLSWHSHPFLADRRVLLDGAHNASSMSSLQTFISSLSPTLFSKCTLILSLSNPRTPSALFDPKISFGRPTTVICVPFSLPQGMPWVRCVRTEEMKVDLQGMKMQDMQVKEEESIENALRVAGTEEDELVVVAGSLYGVADAVRVLERHNV